MRTTRMFVPTLVLIAASALGACMAGDAPPPDMPGDDGTGPGNGSGPVGFITAFASAECMEAHACRGSFPANAGVTFEQAFGATETACEAMAADYYQPDAVRAGVQNGTIAFDRTAADDCLANLSWGTCTQYFQGQSPLPAACGQALVGTVADGGACTIDLECASDADWCGDTGACEPVPTGP